MIKKLVVAVVAGSLCIGAAGCNTVKGLGRDVESVGEAGDRAI